MRRSVQDLLNRDSAKRWGILLRSMVATFTCAVLLQAFGCATGQIQILAALVGGLAYSAQVYLYCEGRSKRYVPTDAMRFLYRPFLLVPAVACLVVLLAAPSTKVEARILNYRLHVVLDSVPSEQTLSEAKRILAYAKRSDVQLHADLVKKASTTYGEAVSSLVVANTAENWADFLHKTNEQLRDAHILVTDAKDFDLTSGHYRILDGEVSDGTAYGNFVFYYAGGPLHLTNAMFLSDQFIIKDTPTSRAFLAQVVAARGAHVFFNSESVR